MLVSSKRFLNQFMVVSEIPELYRSSSRHAGRIPAMLRLNLSSWCRVTANKTTTQTKRDKQLIPSTQNCSCSLLDANSIYCWVWVCMSTFLHKREHQNRKVKKGTKRPENNNASTDVAFRMFFGCPRVSGSHLLRCDCLLAHCEHFL